MPTSRIPWRSKFYGGMAAAWLGLAACRTWLSVKYAEMASGGYAPAVRETVVQRWLAIVHVMVALGFAFIAFEAYRDRNAHQEEPEAGVTEG